MKEPVIYRVEDHLIEQPSWGGDFITRLKGLDQTPRWLGKRVGQSYELAQSSQLIDLTTRKVIALQSAVAENPVEFLGEESVKIHGTTLNLLIKLTQAKGNSFQVHLPEGRTLNHWRPKPEAWFYLGPGLYTFGLTAGTSYAEFSAALELIDRRMRTLSSEVLSGDITLGEAKERAQNRIEELNPYQYVNVIHAKTDDIVDLTAGGIHHSWEEDDALYPQGNLVYEVQVDVQDEFCSMRGFDKGKFLSNGALRPTHITDYLLTVSQDPSHSDLRPYLRRPIELVHDSNHHVESLFRTKYFNLDRHTIFDGKSAEVDSSIGVQHLFILDGAGSLGDYPVKAGESYLIPFSPQSIMVSASALGLTVLQTYLPV